MDYKGMLRQVRNIVLFLLFILLFNTEQIPDNPALELYSHVWCRPCKKANMLFSKLQKKYPEIKFQIHNFTGKSLITSKQTGKSLGFPTILFNCSGMKFTYQNDLSLEDLIYWIQLICYRRVVQCDHKINEQLYHISVFIQNSPSDKLIDEIIKHPHIRICRSQESTHTQENVTAILQETDRKTLFFDYFSNSIRNYLMMSNKLAVGIICTQKNTSRVNSFMNSYINLMNFMGEKPQNFTNLLRYQLPLQQKEHLVFFQLCINSNISKCVYHSQRKNQLMSHQKNIFKIMDIFELEVSKSQEIQQIIAFRFHKSKLHKYTYHNLGVIDEKFLYWISSIISYELKQTKNEKYDQICLRNSITYRIVQNNLQDFETYLQLRRYLKNRQEKYPEKRITLTKIQKSYHQQDKFIVCLEGRKQLTYKHCRDIQNIKNAIDDYFVERALKQSQQL